MKNLLTLFSIIIILCTANVYSQWNNAEPNSLKKIDECLIKKGEIYFIFQIFNKNDLNRITKIISIDNVKGYDVYAYANRNELNEFDKLGYKFTILTHPGDMNPGQECSDNINEIMAWDTYPTYTAYLDMMNSFQTQFPNLVKIYTIGQSVNGKNIVYAKITDSVNFRKPKPRFLYTSTMHGDELTAYVLMLRLIDTLVKGYGTVPQITNLVKNVEIWINPLANPDGTYGTGNTITSPTRYNANGKDLNRNFPDPVGGQNPTGAWQPETIANMNLMTLNNYTLSMNFHGGAQVYNYPWDCKAPYHPEDAWWIHLGRHWVDTVHSVNASYMVDVLGYPNIPGVTNGYAWYIVTGGRQDYMTYFKGGREVTLEISSTKYPAGSQLPNYWNWNYRSFFNYINETLYGVRGIVSDSVTGAPIKSKIYVTQYSDTNWIFSDSVYGDYHRMLATGTYTFKVSAPGYVTKTIPNIYAKYDSTTRLNIQLRPVGTSITNENNLTDDYTLNQNYPNPFNPSTFIDYYIPKESFVTLKIYDNLGREVKTLVNTKLMPGNYQIKWDAGKNNSGIYFYRLTAGEKTITRTMILIK